MTAEADAVKTQPEATQRADHPAEPGPFTILAALWRVLRPELQTHRKGVLKDLGLALAAGAFGLAGPYLLYLLLRAALRDDAVASMPLLALGAVFAYAAYAVLHCAHTNHALRTTEAMLLTLKLRLVRAVMRKPLAFLDASRQAQLSGMLAIDLDKLGTKLRQNAGPTLAGALLALGVLLAILALDWRMGLLVAALTLVYLVGVMSVHRATARADMQDGSAIDQQQHILRDMLDGARDLRLYQVQHLHEARFADVAETVRRRDVRLYGKPIWGWNPVVDFVSAMILLGPALLGIWMHMQSGTSVPLELIPAVLTYAAMMTASLRSLSRGVHALAYLGQALERLETVISYPEEPPRPPPSLDRMPDDQTLRLVGVGRRFGGRSVFERFDLDVAPGERIALIGPSGVGKTTLANLILRVEEPDTGCVMLGGQPAQHFPLPLYLSYFAHVAHHTHLFHTSVRDNIAMGWRHVPFADIERAARLVRLHDMISRLPQGYDTVLGDGALSLSQGQRQRLALARALIREPAVLVLDEFASALDGATKTALLDDLFAAFSGTTIICMTHDPDVMARMDRVITLAPDAAATPPTRPETGVPPRDGTQHVEDPEGILHLPADASALDALAQWVDSRASGGLIPEDAVFHVNLVLDELVSNIVTHGRWEGSGATRIAIGLTRADDTVTLTIEDDGAPFDPTRADPVDTDAPLEQRAVGGLGLHFVRSFMDDVSYRRQGGWNQVTLIRQVR